jgi:lipoprotein-anchoring transpeptidase ErfK/SrfK
VLHAPPPRSRSAAGRRRLAALAVSAAVAACPAAAAAQEPAAADTAPAPAPKLERDGVVSPGSDPFLALREPGDTVRISNETTVTRWTTAVRLTYARSRPDGRARHIARLRYGSASLAPELYGVLRGQVDAGGRAWLQVRIPGRPNGRLGWAPANAFYSLKLARTQLVVNRSTLRATLYRNGRKIWRAPVGVGKTGTPTPRGHYFIDRIEGPIFGPVYGPHVFFTTAFSVLPDWPGGGVVGLHGTNQPGLVPGRPSHGCIRMHNSDANRLARLMPVGTPLRIR